MATYAAFLRETGYDGTSLTTNSLGQLQSTSGFDEYASTWYVDGNRTSAGDGRSWRTAFKTVAAGLAAAQSFQTTSANRAWAKRSRVFCVADKFTEDLVIFAEKTDIIGVGSCNAGKQPCLVGNHVPVTTTTGGTRWINWQFEEVDTGAMFTLTSVNVGIEFHNCTFSNRSTNATHGILATAVYSFKVINCQFESINGFTTGAIVLGAGVTDNNIIRGNLISGAIGVVVDASATNTAGNILIDNNVIRAITLCIDDNSDVALITNNQLISEADNSTIGNCLDYNVALAANNVLTGSSDTQGAPFITIS